MVTGTFLYDTSQHHFVPQQVTDTMERYVRCPRCRRVYIGFLTSEAQAAGWPEDVIGRLQTCRPFCGTPSAEFVAIPADDTGIPVGATISAIVIP